MPLSRSTINEIHPAAMDSPPCLLRALAPWLANGYLDNRKGVR